jgi:virulence-associated protein VapD
MIKVIVNSLGYNDWVRVTNTAGEVYIDDSEIRAFDLVMLLQNLGIQAELVEVTNQEMESM